MPAPTYTSPSYPAATPSYPAPSPVERYPAAAPVVTFGIGLGVSGSVDAQQAFAAIGSGAALTWPDPSASEPAKIDDLLHAAVNSRGEFFSAQDPQSFAKALSDTLGSIAVRNGSNTAAVPSARRLDSETLVYEANFSSADWSGKLLAKRPTQTSTGIVFSDQWEAGRLINPSRKKAGNQWVTLISPGWARPTSTRPRPKLDTCSKN